MVSDINNEVVKITIDNTDINMIIGKRLCYSLEDANKAKKEDEGDYVFISIFFRKIFFHTI